MLNFFFMTITINTIVNFKRIRLNKNLIKKYKVASTIELAFEKEYIILNPKPKTRAGWEKSFRKMHENGDDKLLMPDVFEDEKC